MKRVEAKLAVLLLHQEADARGDDELRIRAATLRKWVQRGHVTRGPGGYDLAEILTYLEQRERSDTVNDPTIEMTVTIRGIHGSDAITCTQRLDPDAGSPTLEQAALRAVQEIARKAGLEITQPPRRSVFDTSDQEAYWASQNDRE